MSLKKQFRGFLELTKRFLRKVEREAYTFRKNFKYYINNNLVKASIEIVEGNLDNAKNKTDSLLARTVVESSKFLNLAARAELGLKNYDLAIARIERSLALHANKPMTYNIKRQIYIDQRRRKKALEVSRDAAAKFPYHKASQIGLLEDLVELEKYQDFWSCLKQVKSVVKTKPKIISLAVMSLRQHVVGIMLRSNVESLSAITAEILNASKSLGLAKNSSIQQMTDLIVSLSDFAASECQLLFVEVNKCCGSIEHYNHFFGAVILPLLETYENRGLPQNSVLLLPDFGPMNPKAEDLLMHLGFKAKFLPDTAVLELKKIGELVDYNLKIILPAYDAYWVSGYSAPHFAVKQARNALRKIADKTCPQNSNSIGNQIITFVYRKPPIHSDRTSGSQRRSIPNASVIGKKLEELPNVTLNYIAFEGMGLVEKFNLMRHTNIFIVQHGAALTAMYWMTPGSMVIELVPKQIQKPKSYSNVLPAGKVLAERMKLNYSRIMQDGTHKPINPDAVFNLCSVFIESGQAELTDIRDNSQAV